jgi:hypothetical protein
MARPVVGNPFENQLPTVSATASPVDVYTRPTEKSGPFAALAASLEQFSRTAQPILEKQERKAAERDLREGQRLYEENRIAIGEAVKQGIIPEGASPYIRKGYRISQMSTLAMRYADELERVLETRKLYQNGSTAKIEEFIGNFQKEFVTANGLSDFSDAEVQEYFGSAANKANEVFRGAWRDKHVAWQKKAAQRAFENQVAMATMTLMQEDASLEERQAALQQLGGYVQTLADGKKIDGVSNEDVINSVLQGVGTIAEYTADDSILDLFDNIKFGTNTASSSLKIQAKIIDIQNKVFTLQERRRVANEREINNANETARVTAGQTVFTFLENPTEDGRAAAEQAIVSLQATGVEKNMDEAFQLSAMLETYDKGLVGANKTSQTEVALDDALSRATTETQARQIIKSYADQEKLTSNDIFTKLNYWRQNYDPSNDEAVGLDFNGNTTEAQAADAFKRAMEGNPDAYDVQKLTNAQAGYSQFKKSYRQAVEKWSAANGGAFPDEQTKEDIASEITRKLLMKYQEADSKNTKEDGAPDTSELAPSNLPTFETLE